MQLIKMSVGTFYAFFSPDRDSVVKNTCYLSPGAKLAHRASNKEHSDKFSLKVRNSNLFFFASTKLQNQIDNLANENSLAFYLKQVLRIPNVK